MSKNTVKKKSSKAKSKTPAYNNLDFTPGFWSGHWKESLIILILPFALYWMCLPYGYVLDDQIVISNNDYTKKGVAGIWDILSKESFSGYFHGQQDLVAGARYRPLSIVTFAIEQTVFGDKPFERHFVNILLYSLLGLLLLRIFSILIPGYDLKKWFIGIPFLTAALYVLHPVHSEVVANIKGRDEIMSTLGSMGALYFVLRFLPSRKLIWLIASGITLFLGLMSKENAITFLAVIPLTMFFFTTPRSKDYFLALVPALIASIIYMVIRTNVIGYVFDSGKKITDIMNDPFIGMNMSERLATILYTLGQYVRLLVFPHPLTHDYYPYHIPIMEFSKPGTLISLAIYLVLAYIFFKLWKKKSIYAWAIGFYIATISIVSNLFFPVGTFMNERFIFLPSIAFSVLCAWMYVRYGVESEKKVLKWGLTGLLLIVIGGYIFKTYVRVPAWKDSLSLNGQAAMVSVNSARNNCFMATALYEEAHKTADPAAKKELFDEAEYYTEKSLAIYPTYLNANQIKSGLVAERYLRDHDLNKLLDEFMKIMRVRPQVEYIPQFLDYLNDRADRETLIDFYYKAGYELVSKTQRDYRTAMVILKVGEKLAPNDPRILFAIGKTLSAGGDQVQGNQYLEKAYQINPALRNVE